MATRLLLIRHGASHHKEQGIIGGPRSCQGLTEMGRHQAAHLRDRLARDQSLIAPIHLYTSVIPRAMETANLIAEAFGGPDYITVRQDCDLCTWHSPPEADGMPITDFQQQYRSAGGGVYHPFETGNESWAELVIRAGRALWGIAQRHHGETAIVVTHAEIVKASLIVFGDLPLRPAFEMQVANTSLTEWTTDDDTLAWPPAFWTLIRFNDSAQLEG